MLISITQNGVHKLFVQIDGTLNLIVPFRILESALT